MKVKKMTDEKIEPAAFSRCVKCGLKALPEEYNPQPCPRPGCDGTVHNIKHAPMSWFRGLLDDFVDRIEEKPNIQLTHATIKQYLDKTVRQQLESSEDDGE